MTNCFYNNHYLNLSISLYEILFLSGAIIGFCVALWQYKNVQKWKKTEFVRAYYKECLENFNFKRAMRMLDWNIIDIPLQKGEIEHKGIIWFNDDMLKRALKDHSEFSYEEGFSDEESVIRFIFDEYFEHLGDFYFFIKSKLITKQNIPSNVKYYIDIIGDQNNISKDNETRYQIWKYIERYGYEDVINLCQLYGYDIKRKKHD